MPKSEVERFVDNVFSLYPKEAAGMARQAADGEMGFGQGAYDYGSVDGGKNGTPVY